MNKWTELNQNFKFWSYRTERKFVHLRKLQNYNNFYIEIIFIYFIFGNLKLIVYLTVIV